MLQSAPPEMSQEELALFNELFSSRFGLYFPDHKRGILESRLHPRLRANHLQRFIDYYLMLQYDFQRELDPLARAITNNESYFFRETGQFDALVSAADELRAGSTPFGRLRVLSAGCSSGEEPYTLNIYLRHLKALSTAGLSIDAIDLDTERLQQALAGVDRPSSMRALDGERIDRFFLRCTDGDFELRPQFRQGVRFAHGNILDLSSFQAAAPYDAVFCRNVLI